MGLRTQREQLLPPPAAPRECAVLEPVPEPAARFQAPWPSRFLPSLTDLVFLLPLWFVVSNSEGVASLLGDGDTGWHVRTGEWILAHGRVPHQDLFSFTKAGQPWFAWEWLWDLMFGWLHQQWGMAAVVLGSLLILSTTFAVVYRLARWKSGQPVLAFLVTLAAVGASSIHWLARPHLVSWLFTAVFLWLLERAAAGETGRLWWLPALMVLWTNLHGGFVAGLLLVGGYAGGELIGGLVAPAGPARTAALARFRGYGLAGLGCAAATLVNPYGWALHAHIGRYLTEPFQFDTIIEFLSPSFHHPMAIYFELLIVLALIASGWEILQGRFVYPVLLAGWLHLSLYSVRNVPLLALVSVAPVSAMLAAALARLERAEVARWLRRAAGGIRRLGSEVAAIDMLPRIPVAPAAAVLLLGVLMWAQPSRAFVAEYPAKRYPARAAEYLSQAGWLEKLYADDEWGDYLIYRLYPRLKVFTDGRSDFYGEKFGKQYVETLRGQWRWERPLNRYQIRTVLVPVDSPLASTLKESARWRLVYDDGVANIFRRAGAPPAELAGEKPLTAIPNGGPSAIVRSHSINPVIPGSQSYARR